MVTMYVDVECSSGKVVLGISLLNIDSTPLQRCISIKQCFSGFLGTRVGFQMWPRLDQAVALIKGLERRHIGCEWGDTILLRMLL